MGTISAAAKAGRERYLRERWPSPAAFTGEQEQLLLGSLLGDGCLHHRGGEQSPYYMEVHGEAQRDYLVWKAEALHDIRPNLRHRRPNRVTGSAGWLLSTGRVPVLRPYYEAFYPEGNGRKVVPDLVYERVGPLALAVWLMDDGSFQQHRHFVLSTDGYPLDTQERLVAWLDARWSLHPAIDRLIARPSGRTIYRLRFRVGETQDLLRLIEPHVHPLFRTKWRLDDPTIWRAKLGPQDVARVANARRSELIREGVLTVGYHTGTRRRP